VGTTRSRSILLSATQSLFDVTAGHLDSDLGVSCTTRTIEWLGFITIPLLSLVAFMVIILCTLLYRRNQASAA
jgi:disulfide bond formation protein DsbB